MKPDILLVGPPMPRVADALAADFIVHRLRDQGERNTLPLDVAARVRGLVTHEHIGAGPVLMDALPSLEIIASHGVGTEGIDLARAAAKGITVTNTPGLATDDVADLAIGLLLAVMRDICGGDRFVRDGHWRNGHWRDGHWREEHGAPALRGPGMSLTGRRMGVLGLGRIGGAVARRALPFEMAVAYAGPRHKPEEPYDYYPDPLQLARESDILVVCCPGIEATRNLVGRDVLAALGSGGILVNVARGPVVDEAALVEALHLGRIAGAGLDVFASEPRVPEALLTMPNVVLSPHRGGGTRETVDAMEDLVVQNLRAHFVGTPVVTPVLPPVPPALHEAH